MIEIPEKVTDCFTMMIKRLRTFETHPDEKFRLASQELLELLIRYVDSLEQAVEKQDREEYELQFENVHHATELFQSLLAIEIERVELGL